MAATVFKTVLFTGLCLAAMITDSLCAPKSKGMNILFIGNSFTGRNRLTDVIKELALAADPDCNIVCTPALYGGQKLEAHWEKYRTYNWLKLNELTEKDLQRTCDEIQAEIDKGSDDTRIGACLAAHKHLLELLKQKPPKWDFVVLQSYVDTQSGMDSPYAKYARKFAELVKKQGGRVILYGTTRTALNAQALPGPPDPAPAIEEAKFFARLAKEIDALVVPVFYGVNCCQRERPSITLRWVNDGHPNQKCTYLTACMFYAVLFDKSPEGLPVNKVCDSKSPDKDPDGGPSCVEFDDDLRTFFQKTAWEAVKGYEKIAGEATRKR